MSNDKNTSDIQNIKYSVIYSGRRTLGISIKSDASVIVRVPYRTSDKTIRRLVQGKAAWIIKHRDYYRNEAITRTEKLYTDGEEHLFRGNKCGLKILSSARPFYRLYNGTIELGLAKTTDSKSVKAMLYNCYKNEAATIFPESLNRILQKYKEYNFHPTSLVIRTMRRRWGSCSNKGIITLNTELIRLPEVYMEYVIIHELCHLRQHNHGPLFYKLLSELFPEWKKARKELRGYIQ